MRVGAPSEIHAGETRVAMTPSTVRQFSGLGHTSLLQSGAGSAAGFSDSEYVEAGAEIVASTEDLWRQSDVVVKVRPPDESELANLRKDQFQIGFFYPARNPDSLKTAAATGATVMAMDMVPRISRAQKMDALSSMANIAGYRAVIEAGNNFGRFFTGQMTAAGKTPPATILVIGAGVAGLAAIGAAQALGAVVRAFDVRAEVAEQIESLGAEFLMLEFDEEGSGSGGYAAPSSPEFRAKQHELFRQQAPEVDIVVTTALVPGHEAPRLWLRDMVEAMKPGSVIVDLAAEQGGNCELTVADERIVTDNGVIVIGYTDFPGRMATQSSTLYASNVFHMIDDLTPENDGVIQHDMDDDVIRGATVVCRGEVTWPPPALAEPVKAPGADRSPEPVKSAEDRAREAALAEARSLRQTGFWQSAMLIVGGFIVFAAGHYAPPSFMQHFVVFALACFVGYQVIWNVNHALHTPLMAITNAISGIIIVGALLQLGTGNWLVTGLAGIAVLIAAINVVGGFLVTRRMLNMFQRS
ncbi:MAG: Re/Si-specific NAD(P)(+) transhydrogenase subunit alpha [Paracoccaceae bacterium]|nr:Re/Si-specific NAD(P)(+) transhydrogenase subunit alpha [Paracoccaceae bacterium]